MIPRIQLAHLPTPIEPMLRLSHLLGGPQLLVKRDDQTGLALGGNKTRKLEFLAADALAEGANMLISAGAVQSNHCRQVAAVAARLGMRCKLVLFGTPPEIAEGNFLLYKLFNAEVIMVDRSQRDSRLQEVFEEARSQGEKPYLIPYGGSNALGAIAYAFAFEEMLGQQCFPDWIVFPSSSGGTQAGLILGAKRAGFTGRILGISVDEPQAALQDHVLPLAESASLLLGDPLRFSREEVLVNADFNQLGYAVMGESEKEAILLFARQEGLLLDPVYTGRAAAGLITLVRAGFFKQDEKVLFWHTGGTPALFAQKYSQVLAS